MHFIVTIRWLYTFMGLTFDEFTPTKQCLQKKKKKKLLIVVIAFCKLEKDSFSAPTWHSDYSVQPFSYPADVWLLILKVSNIHVMDELTFIRFSAALLLCFCWFAFNWQSVYCLLLFTSLVIENEKALVWFPGHECNITTIPAVIKIL